MTILQPNCELCSSLRDDVAALEEKALDLVCDGGIDWGSI
jgi:hypothetical protein